LLVEGRTVVGHTLLVEVKVLLPSALLEIPQDRRDLSPTSGSSP
jgi:hypothetical protein